MPKKFKVKTYEKDNDDHYVVVLNPWTQGYKRSQEQIDWMGAWLRIAFGKPKEKHIVKNIYSVETRSEVIVRISASADIRLGLGLHRWGEFMKEEQLERIKLKSRVDLSDNISHIFLYNWTLHGDPAEHQWQEWFPRQDEIPPNIMIKMDYPEPEWSEMPPSDSRLRSLLLPLPIPALNYDLTAVQIVRTASNIAEDSIIENRLSSLHHKQEETKARKNGAQINGLQTNSRSASETTLYSSYQPPLHLPRSEQDADRINPAPGPSKAGKLDPYEEDDKAQACLSIKTEAEDIKSTIQGAGDCNVNFSLRHDGFIKLGYRPSKALSRAVSDLLGEGFSDESDRKPVVKSEEQDMKPNLRTNEYRPSDGLARAISELRGSTVHSDKEDRKPTVKKEEYNPSGALHDAFSRYSGESMLDTDGSRNRNPKRRLKKEDGAGVAGPSDPKRTKTDMA